MPYSENSNYQGLLTQLLLGALASTSNAPASYNMSGRMVSAMEKGRQAGLQARRTRILENKEKSKTEKRQQIRAFSLEIMRLPKDQINSKNLMVILSKYPLIEPTEAAELAKIYKEVKTWGAEHDLVPKAISDAALEQKGLAMETTVPGIRQELAGQFNLDPRLTQSISIPPRMTEKEFGYLSKLKDIVPPELSYQEKAEIDVDKAIKIAQGSRDPQALEKRKELERYKAELKKKPKKTDMYLDLGNGRIRSVTDIEIDQKPGSRYSALKDMGFKEGTLTKIDKEKSSLEIAREAFLAGNATPNQIELLGKTIKPEYTPGQALKQIASAERAKATFNKTGKIDAIMAKLFPEFKLGQELSSPEITKVNKAYDRLIEYLKKFTPDTEPTAGLRDQAIEILKQRGFPLTNANIVAVMDQIDESQHVY